MIFCDFKNISLTKVEKNFLVLVILFLGHLIFLSAQSELIVVPEKDKFGCINLKGEMVIPPKFRTRLRFIDGLAAAREDGFFGIIDTTGEWVVEPIYDYVQGNGNGKFSAWTNVKMQRLLYPDSIKVKPKLSTMIGRLPTDYRGYKIFTDNFGKKGLRNINDELVLAPAYDFIFIGYDHFFTVGQRNNGGTNYKYALLDTLGQTLIPFGKYARIESLGEGWVYVKDTLISDYGLLNINSGSYFPTKVSNKRLKRFSEGLIPYSYPTYIPENFEVNYSTGYMDTTLQIVLTDSTWYSVGPFDQGVALVFSKKQKQLFLINKQGETLNDKPILKSIIHKNSINIVETSDFFYNDWAFIKIKEGIAKMNRAGEVFLIEGLENMTVERIIENRYLITKPRRINGIRKKGNRGVYDLLKQKKSPIYADEITPIIYKNESLMVKYRGKFQLVKFDGEVLWQQKEKIEPLPYDVHNMVRLKRRKKYPKKLHWLQRWFLNKPRLYKDARKKLFKEKYAANNLYVLNPSKDTLVFATTHGKIHLLVEAKNLNGEWKPINKCLSNLTKTKVSEDLPPGHYWYFRLPKFKGFYKTKLRATISYYKKGAPNKQYQLVKKFKGGINPGQFIKYY